jgi:hypothetical protein
MHAAVRNAAYKMDEAFAFDSDPTGQVGASATQQSRSPERKTTTAATSVDGKAPAAAAKKPRAGMSSTAINALRAAVDAFVARVTSPATGRKAPWPLADLVPLAVRDDSQEYLKKTKAHELRALYARVETSFETLVRFPLTKEAYGKLDRFVRAFPGCDARRREVGPEERRREGFEFARGEVHFVDVVVTAEGVAAARDVLASGAKERITGLVDTPTA